MDGDSRIWWWFGDKFNALIKNPNGKDSIEGDVLVTSPLWINEKPKFQKMEFSTYTWIIVLIMDGDSRIWWWFGDKSYVWIKKPNGNDSVKGDVLVACPLWIN